MRHPLFDRPWAELVPTIWASYLLGPPLVTALVMPVSDLADPSRLGVELYRSTIGVWCGLALIHFLEAVVAPRVLPPLFGVRRLLAHGGVLAIALGISAEITRLWLEPSAPPGPFRLQYYRFALIYGGSMMVSLVIYDSMRSRTAMIELEKELVAREARLAQLEALQIRTEPHFLFNTLNTIACLVELDAKKAIEAIDRMSALFRFMLDSSREPRIPLAVELEAVRRYLEIEALRYDNLRYRFRVSAAAAEVRIPPLLVQPLVENAVKHGIARAAAGGEVEIAADRVGDVLALEVSNTPGDGGAAPGGAGRSIELIRQRLDLAFGERARFDHGPRGDGRYASRVEISVDPA